MMAVSIRLRTSQNPPWAPRATPRAKPVLVATPKTNSAVWPSMIRPSQPRGSNQGWARPKPIISPAWAAPHQARATRREAPGPGWTGPSPPWLLRASQGTRSPMQAPWAITKKPIQ